MCVYCCLSVFALTKRFLYGRVAWMSVSALGSPGFEAARLPTNMATTGFFGDQDWLPDNDEHHEALQLKVLLTNRVWQDLPWVMPIAGSWPKFILPKKGEIYKGPRTIIWASIEGSVYWSPFQKMPFPVSEGPLSSRPRGCHQFFHVDCLKCKGTLHLLLQPQQRPPKCYPGLLLPPPKVSIHMYICM